MSDIVFKKDGDYCDGKEIYSYRDINHNINVSSNSYRICLKYKKIYDDKDELKYVISYHQDNRLCVGKYELNDDTYVAVSYYEFSEYKDVIYESRKLIVIKLFGDKYLVLNKNGVFTFDACHNLSKETALFESNYITISCAEYRFVNYIYDLDSHSYYLDKYKNVNHNKLFNLDIIC